MPTVVSDLSAQRRNNDIREQRAWTPNAAFRVEDVALLSSNHGVLDLL